MRATRLAALIVALGLPATRARADQPAPAPEPAPPPAPAPAPEPAPAPAPTRFFYVDRDDGSASMFGPLWVFVNRGYDVLQDHVAPRDIFSFDYRTNTGNVLRNVLHPFPAIRNDGWSTFLREEIFPLSFTPATARWTPNYSLHLIGGGMTYRALAEWFEDHHTPAPRVFAAATVMLSALVNESLENHGVVGYNTDCLADLYVFDVGGIVLFSFDWPARFFSQEVILADWSLQPTFTGPRGELHNVGNYFSAKWALPFYRRLSLFAWFGEATTGGLSFKLTDDLALSAAAGGAVVHLTNQATNTVQNTVNFVATGALFLDRRNSLLASLQVTNTSDYFIHLNVYPHAFTARGPAIGGWLVMDKQARFAGGIAVGRAFGQPVGLGAGWSGL